MNALKFEAARTLFCHRWCLLSSWDKYKLRKQGRLRAVSLFSVVRRAKRETRKWPRA